MREQKTRLTIDTNDDINTFRKEHMLYVDINKPFEQWVDENREHIKKEFEIELLVNRIVGLRFSVYYNSDSLKVTSMTPE
jgi:hypothetical protein